MKDFKNKLILGFIFGVAVFVGLGIYADFSEMLHLLQGFNWNWLPVILGLTVLNYGVRFAKWHYYLGRIGVKNVPVWDDLLIFIGGFGLTLTPGKVGELVRMVWLKNRVGVHPAKTAPMAFAERLTDGIAMALLALLGGFVYPQYWPVIIPIGSMLVLAVIAVQIRPLALWFLNLGEKLPRVSKFVHHLHTLYESAYILFTPKNLLIAVGLGIIGWISEGIAFYLVVVGLGVPGSTTLFFLTIFIFSFAAIAGGASGLPGGLGVTEGSITGMLQILATLPENLAATATLLIRFCTMWFGITLGVLVMLIWRTFLFGEKAESPETLSSEFSAEKQEVYES